MNHLKAVNRKAVRVERATDHDVVALQRNGLPQAPHGGIVPAGRARPVRLSHRLLLAGAGTRPVESRARLDGEMRRRPEGLAQDRSHFPVTIMKRLAVGSAVLMIAGVALLHAQKSRPSAAAAAGNGTLI